VSALQGPNGLIDAGTWFLSVERDDLFIHERVRYLRVDEDARETLASLRRMQTLQPRLLICAHAGLVEDACGAIARKINLIRALLDEDCYGEEVQHPLHR
jgi:hypothetical protein